METMAMSPVCFRLLLHIVLLRGQGLEIEKQDIKQQDFNVSTPQSLPAMWLCHARETQRRAYTSTFTSWDLIISQFCFCLCVFTESTVVYNLSNLLNLL